MYKLGKRSLERLNGLNSIHKVVRRAIELTEVDFTVLEGLRDLATQLEYWKRGASKLNGVPKGERFENIIGTGISSHQKGEAVDLGAYVSGSVRWDWPLYFKIASAMRKAAIELKVPVIWGGVWDRKLNSLTDDLEEEMHQYALRRRKLGKKPFHDGPHFQTAYEDDEKSFRI